MKLTISIILSAAAIAVAQQQSVQQAVPQAAQPAQVARRVSKPQVIQSQAIPNEKMDYAGFLKIAGDVEKMRASRRVTEERFIEMAAEAGTVVLDARSRDKYEMRHIKGAVSLPFTDFTAESLAKVIPNKQTRVLIYCNNNFLNDERAFAGKVARAALNINTFISLTTYGYENVYELGPRLDVNKAKVEWAGTKAERTEGQER